MKKMLSDMQVGDVFEAVEGDYIMYLCYNENNDLHHVFDLSGCFLVEFGDTDYEVLFNAADISKHILTKLNQEA